jgi:hypothetical protein
LVFPQPLVYSQPLVFPKAVVFPKPVVLPKPVVFAQAQNILSVPVQTEEFRMVRTEPVVFSPLAAEAAPKRWLLQAAGISHRYGAMLVDALCKA